jgi:hypothetical protein
LADTQAGLRMMIQTLGVFNLLIFGVCAWFTWGNKIQKSKIENVQAPGQSV